MSKKDVSDFLTYCGMTATASTLNKIRVKIEQIDKFFNGNLGNLELKDIHVFFSDLNKRGFATSTKNDFIKVFKRFLKWKYKDWNLRFNELKDLKANSNDQRKLSKEEILSNDEMNLIINSTDSMKYKTLLLLFQETACRPEEILRKLKWKEINFDRKEIKLSSSKTGKTRFIPINKTIGHLKRYREECFTIPPKADDIIFTLSNEAVGKFLRNAEERLKFTKHLYPYLWRHSVLTRMITKLSPKAYEMFAGHSLETGMKVYAHLDNEDLREELNDKIYKIQELTQEEKNNIEELNKRIKRQEELSKRKDKVFEAMFLDQEEKIKELTELINSMKK